MSRIISEKKKAESSDGKQGRTKHQKLKSYIVTQYLLKNTDEDHPASAKDIIAIWRTSASLLNAAPSIGITRLSHESNPAQKKELSLQRRPMSPVAIRIPLEMHRLPSFFRRTDSLAILWDGSQ